MKLGPLLLLSLLVHGVLLLALRAAPALRPAETPPAPSLVWMQLAPAPAGPGRLAAVPVPAAPAAPAVPPAVPATAPVAPPAVPSVPGPASASVRGSGQPARARQAAPAPRVPAAADEPGAGVEIPVEAEGGTAVSPAPGGERALSGPGLSVPVVPGPVQAGAPPPAPVSPRFDVRAYADLVRRRIDAEKQYPARARRLGLQGVATVLVAVDTRGRLVRPPRLARTSGVAALDDEALRMVQAAAPFPPPAGASLTAPVEVQVPVRFSLADAL
jgi:TonB family protein